MPKLDVCESCVHFHQEGVSDVHGEIKYDQCWWMPPDNNGERSYIHKPYEWTCAQHKERK